MSKSAKVKALKPHFQRAIKKLIMANVGAYGGKAQEGVSVTAALGQALMLRAKQFKEKTQHVGVSKQDWLEMGLPLYQKLATAKDDSINAVCDTCSALTLYILNSIINFSGTFELFAETSIHHHYVVVNRATGSDPTDHSTWGGDAFVIDMWQAKFAGRETTDRGFFSGTAHHYQHGIYRNPGEHVYTRKDVRGRDGKVRVWTTVCEETWTK